MPKLKTAKPETEQVNVRLSPEARRQLDELTDRWGEDQSQAVRRAIALAWCVENRDRLKK